MLFVAVAGAAALLYGLLNGFGGGSGGAFSVVPSDSNSGNIPVVDSNPATSEVVHDAESELRSQAARASARVVEVSINEREFVLHWKTDGEERQQPLPLEEVVALAEQATGDDEGARVRVRVPSSAFTSAELQLREALRNAGIPDDHQRWTY